METNFKLNDDTFKTPRQMYDLDPGIADTRILVQYLSHVPLSYASSSWPGPMPMNPLENKGEGALGLWKDSSSLPKAELGAGAAFLLAQTVKNLPAMQQTRVQSLGQEYPLEKGMTTHSSILPWEIP